MQRHSLRYLRRSLHYTAVQRLSFELLKQRPNADLDYFTIFDLSRSAYALSAKDLHKSFLKLQRLVHPDTSTVAHASEWSELVNKAYKTLSSDLDRAEYMLLAQGVEIGEAESLTDPELLMQVMEIREALEEAAEQGEIDQIRQDNKTEMQENTQAIDQAFEAQQFEEAKTLTVKLRYLQNIEGVCREWQPGKRIELQH